MFRAILTLSFAFLAACSSGSSPSSGPTTPTGYTKADYDKFCPRVTLPSGQIIKYCARSPQKVYSNTDIVYFFHGSGGDGTDIDLEPFNTLYGQAAGVLGDRTPWVVAIDYGPDATIDLTGSQLDELQDIVFPQIENDLGYHRPDMPPVRHLVGMSLGGFNALHVAAGRPQLFKSIAALCPALYTFDPFNATAMQSFISSTPTANPNLVHSTVSQLIQKYGTEDAWTANNPLALAQSGDYDSLNVFISTGQQDEYGFFPGAQLLAQTLTQRGKNPIWMPVNGGHCSFDTSDLLSFLSTNISTP